MWESGSEASERQEAELRALVSFSEPLEEGRGRGRGPRPAASQTLGRAAQGPAPWSPLPSPRGLQDPSEHCPKKGGLPPSLPFPPSLTHTLVSKNTSLILHGHQLFPQYLGSKRQTCPPVPPPQAPGNTA